MKPAEAAPTSSCHRSVEAAELVLAAAAGDEQAWESLVRLYVALLWRIALRHGLSESDAADVVQTTWLRLLEHIGGIREPARVASWLSTTAQRESLRCIAHRQRVVPVEGESAFEGVDPLQPSLDDQLIAQDQSRALRSALAQLPAGWRSLLELLSQEPPPSYEEISADLGMPVGSIGPTRGRSLLRLRGIMVT